MSDLRSPSMDHRGAVEIGKRRSDDGLVEMHLRYLRNEVKSPLTVRARAHVLARLERYLQAPPAGASRTMIEEYLDHRRDSAGRGGSRVSPNTIRNEVAHLRAYYGWLVQHEYRRDNPTDRLAMPRLIHAHVQAADDDAIVAALAGADIFDTAILSLAAFAGLRAAEIAALDWADIDIRATTITVRHGKGDKRRTLHATGPVMEALLALPHRRYAVIPRRDGQNLANVATTISRRGSTLLGGRAGGFTLHQLRHRFATAAYAGCQDLRAVQEMMGHANPQTTAIYAHNRGEKLKYAAEAAAVLHLSSAQQPA